MKSSSTGEIKMEGGKKKQPPIHTANRRGLGSAAPGAISKSQITAPYLRNHISPLSSPEIGSSLSCASRSSLEMLFIRDYRQPLNKRCLCLRSKVLGRFRTPQILQRVLEAEHLIWPALLGVVYCREMDESVADGKYETRPQNFSDASYRICFQRGFILR